MSTDARERHPPIKRFMAGLVDAGRTRLELGATELAEERLRLSHQAMLVAVALLCLGIGFILAVNALAWWAGPEQGGAVFGAGAVLAFIGAAAALLWWKRLLREQPPLLHETLAQLRADIQALMAQRP